MTLVVAHRRLNTQAQRVLRALVERGSLTAADAVAMHPPIFRLAARVKELRESFGESAIVTIHEKHDGGTHARYRWSAVGETQSDMFA